VLSNIWFSLFPALYVLNQHIVQDYGKQYRQLKKERVFHQFIGSVREDPQLGIWNNTDTGTEQRNQARAKRQGGFYQNLLECDPHKIESEKQFEKIECVPFIFEETLMRKHTKKEASTFNAETMEESFTANSEQSFLTSEVAGTAL
jgi:hypothetical protein